MESHPQTYVPTNTYLSAVAWDLFDFFRDNPFKTSLNSWLFWVLSSNMLFFTAVNCAAADLRRKYSLCVCWDYFHLAHGEVLCFLDTPLSLSDTWL